MELVYSVQLVRFFICCFLNFHNCSLSQASLESAGTSTKFADTYLQIMIMLYVFCTADQLYGDQEMHGVVRKNVVDYMASHHFTLIDYYIYYSLSEHPGRPIFRWQSFPQSSSTHPHLIPNCSINFLTLVQAEFQSAGLQVKAQSHKIYTFKSRKEHSPWYFLECALDKSNGTTEIGVCRLFPCFLTSQAGIGHE